MDTSLSQKKRRSRGCDQCRKRRVKCDETSGCCKQCLRFGLGCSGLLDGALVVEMTYNAPGISISSSVVKCRYNSVSKRRNRSVSSSTEVVNPASAKLAIRQVEDALVWPGTLSPHIMLNVDQPSILTEQLFLAQFMDFTRPSRPKHTLTPWILSVPEQISCSKLPSFRHSMRAAVTAFHAFLDQDEFAKEASCRWYIASLQSHRNFLSATNYQPERGSLNVNIPGIEEVLVPTFLCLFEIVSCTTSTGCFQHLAAACRIIHLRGPKNCQTGVAHQIFRSLRISDACAAMMEPRSSLFASEEWRTFPFFNGEMPLLHKLVDLLLILPEHLCVSDLKSGQCLKETLNQLSTQPKEKREIVQQNCLNLLLELSAWWREFETENSRPEDFTSNTDIIETQLSPISFIYRDTFTAFMVSLYNAVCLTTHYSLHLINPNSPELPRSQTSHPGHLAQAASHASSILMISEYQRRSTIIGFDLIRSTFALKAVQALGPTPELELQARQMSEDWGGLGLNGILKTMREHPLSVD